MESSICAQRGGGFDGMPGTVGGNLGVSVSQASNLTVSHLMFQLVLVGVLGQALSFLRCEAGRADTYLLKRVG
jgi:hypothetical protein